MKYFFFLMALMICSFSLAQDTLTGGEQQVIRLFGDLFNETRKKALEDMRSNGDKSILGQALKETMTGIARRTKDRILQGGLTPGQIFQPTYIEKNKSLLLERGKSNLLSDFQSSLSQAARQALINSAVKMAEQVTELNVEALIKQSDQQSLQITDLFRNMQYEKLTSVARPFAKAALKLTGGQKLYKKISKELKKTGTTTHHALSIDQHTANVVTDLFFEALSAEEKSLKSNPLKALELLMDVWIKKE